VQGAIRPVAAADNTRPVNGRRLIVITALSFGVGIQVGSRHRSSGAAPENALRTPGSGASRGTDSMAHCDCARSASRFPESKAPFLFIGDQCQRRVNQGTAPAAVIISLSGRSDPRHGWSLPLWTLSI
jgi:hypothetical protein